MKDLAIFALKAAMLMVAATMVIASGIGLALNIIGAI